MIIINMIGEIENVLRKSQNVTTKSTPTKEQRISSFCHTTGSKNTNHQKTKNKKH